MSYGGAGGGGTSSLSVQTNQTRRDANGTETYLSLPLSLPIPSPFLSPTPRAGKSSPLGTWLEEKNERVRATAGHQVKRIPKDCR